MCNTAVGREALHMRPVSLCILRKVAGSCVIAGATFVRYLVVHSKKSFVSFGTFEPLEHWDLPHTVKWRGSIVRIRRRSQRICSGTRYGRTAAWRCTRLPYLSLALIVQLHTRRMYRLSKSFDLGVQCGEHIRTDLPC